MQNMKLSQLKSILSDQTPANGKTKASLPRYAAMVGIEIQPAWLEYSDHNDMEIPDEKVREMLALDFAERRTNDLRVMGEGIAKLHFDVNVPSNINVWQHLKGDTALSRAIAALTTAAENLQKVAR